MKKFLVVLIAALFALIAFACRGNDNQAAPAVVETIEVVEVVEYDADGEEEIVEENAYEADAE
ncbi:MAG: hypothetical protein FWE23_05820 [Chitinivibrionia bacterium]|nr:hypothetical protein [Chitinivibrionia bacterium]